MDKLRVQYSRRICIFSSTEGLTREDLGYKDSEAKRSRDESLITRIISETQNYLTPRVLTHVIKSTRVIVIIPRLLWTVTMEKIHHLKTIQTSLNTIERTVGMNVTKSKTRKRFNFTDR